MRCSSARIWSSPNAICLLAYDDPLKVTAAFNRNLLRRINDELGGNFDLAAFTHQATWNAAAQRVEAYLVNTRPQRVSIPGAGIDIALREGERIWTESSYKLRREPGDGRGACRRFQRWRAVDR